MTLDTNIYRPHGASIEAVREEAPNVKTFTLRFSDPTLRDGFDYRPGQFVQVSAPHCGEAPISITSTPTRRGTLELCIRRAGLLTGGIHQLGEGAPVGLRGPYGNGFPLEALQGKDLLFVAGGIGLAPLRSLINYALDRRPEFGRLTILYGARTPSDCIFRDDLKSWGGAPAVQVLTTVDTPDAVWAGHVGVVTALLDKVDITPEKTCAIICGPPVMFSFATKDLLRMGLRHEAIISSTERHMKCGVGKCGHCSIVGKYVCTDGPVFSYQEMKDW